MEFYCNNHTHTQKYWRDELAMKQDKRKTTKKIQYSWICGGALTDFFQVCLYPVKINTAYNIIT